ncbi:MAG: CoA-binding protein [Ignavibacteriales bacterium]|nr:CoA-binding protein [Ignavibacteriales bacterium]
MKQQSSEETIIEQMLSTAKTIAVVGLSNKPESSSYGIGRYLIRAGYKIIPVNPMHDEVFGIQCVQSLKEISEQVDIVDIFRRPEFIPEIVDDAITIGAKGIWMQTGIINELAAEKANAAGIPVVMDRCISVAHRQYLHLHNVQ